MANILIVDKDPIYHQMLSRILTNAGYTAAVTTDGQQALAVIREERPDLVLLEAILPALDGYAVVRALKDDPETAAVPILFVTGATDLHHKLRGLKCGANDYLTKPFHRAELLARIAVALRIRRREQELIRKNEELAVLARTDALTELPNRRAFEERLEQELARVRRHDHPLSVLMIDIDHFKQINDAILHTGGDQMLRAITRCLHAHIRCNDLVARYGGEEFVVLCPDTYLSGARIVAERMREAVENLYADGVTPLPITVSIGVVMLTPESVVVGEALMAAADAALYEAKRAGRNRVVSGGNLSALSLPQAPIYSAHYHVQGAHIPGFQPDAAENTPQRV